MLSLLFAAALLGRGALAQTWTACNPLNTTCPNDPALGTSHNFVFNTSSSVTDTFNITAGSLNYGANGAEFTINQKGDSPTIESQFYFFFGSVSVVMQAATGQGVISSIVLESDDLDEVDWEFMGGNSTHAETNYFGKGNTTAYDRAIYYPVSSDPRKNMHNYTVNWTSERLEWYIDSQLVRTLPYAAANGGDNYPQTPMTLRLGIWAGGDPGNSKGTIEWAGGEIDYNKGPYTMYVQSAQVNDYSTGSAYEYSDHSGSWQSIKSIAGNSTAVKAIAKENEPAPPTAAQKFQALSTGTKAAIYAGAGAGAAVLFAAFLFFFIKQRRAGRLERDAYNKLVEQQREEAFKDQQALREKGLGGFDANSTKGEDALGGWSGNEAAAEEPPPMPKMPMNVVANEIPRSGSPAIPRVASPALSRVGSPAPGIKRLQSPPLVSPVPQHPTVPAWAANGNANANNGGLINNAGNAYSGGYGGNPNPAPSRTPSFPFPAQGRPQPRPSPGGYNQGGYNQGGYNQGGYNQGGYNQGGYNQGGYQRY